MMSSKSSNKSNQEVYEMACSIKIEIFGKDNTKISEEEHIFDGMKTMAPISTEVFNENDRKVTVIVYSKNGADETWVERKKVDFEYTFDDKPLGEPERGVNGFEKVDTHDLSYKMEEDKEFSANFFTAIV